jgi:Na+/H+ antiporter NhaD/arsenite permease-like protein
LDGTWLAAAIFAVTYAVIVSERVHKTAAALAGAVAMILAKVEVQTEGSGGGVFGQEAAFRAIDFNVIFLLAGMMIIVNVLAKTGVFQWVAIRSAKLGSGSPIRILVILSLVTAVTSAFLDNVTTVVLIAPVTIFVAGALGVSAVPFLISEALASNVGGAATLIGDPPNILIASQANLDFVSFVVNMGPVILLILAAYLLLARFLFSKQLVTRPELQARLLAMDESEVITDPRLLRISLVILGLTIFGFVIHGVLDYEPATVALFGAAAILVVSRQHPHEILREVEWSTLFFFVGLFIVVGGMEAVGILEDIGKAIADLTAGSTAAATMLILWFSAFASGIVDNIPYTTTMLPVVDEVGRSLDSGKGTPNVLWWSLALGADLGGNLTVIAASANVLVANLAERGGQKIPFWEFFRYGALVTLLSVLVSSLYLWLRYLL